MPGLANRRVDQFRIQKFVFLGYIKESHKILDRATLSGLERDRDKNMKFSTGIIALLLFALAPAPHASATMTLYRGEMELATVSGGGCSENDKPGSLLSLELTLERDGSGAGGEIAGYFNGPDIQVGRFAGNDLGGLQVVYPDAPNRLHDNSLVLSLQPGGVDGELHEQPQSEPTYCYFEKAVLNLKQVATGSEAESVHARQTKLFAAEAFLTSGQALLKADKPEEAIADLTKSLSLRDLVNPNDPDRAIPAVSLAVAQVRAGREAQALTVLRDLVGNVSETGDALLKLRASLSASLCSEEQYLENDAGQKAVLRLMDLVAREFGTLKGVSAPLAACYDEMAREQREQEDPDSAIELFQKAHKINPDDPESIAGVVMSYVDKDAPVEGRKYLDEHAKSFIKRAGKEPYDILLANLYAAEAQQVENDGDLRRAEELSREAIKARPGERSLIIELTRVLAKEGKTAEARKLLVGGGKGCKDATCRQDYADELARQDMIERIVKRLESSSSM